MATLAQHIDAPQVSGAYKVDISRGRNIGRVSSEWYSRPDDEKFLSLDDLYENVRRRADRARTRIVESRDVRVEASMDNAERLSLIVPGAAEPIAPTNWSFGQLSSLEIGRAPCRERAVPYVWIWW